MGFKFKSLHISVFAIIVAIILGLAYMLIRRYSNSKEGFDNPISFDSIVKPDFSKPTKYNPMSNVLLTDIVDNPNKLPAPPAYYEETEKEILDKTKEAIQKMNPTFPNMTEKLFASLDDHFEFEQSARQFYSNPSTTIPNDQGAFAEFCYGEMISCKEGNMFACARDAPRHNLY